MAEELTGPTAAPDDAPQQNARQSQVVREPPNVPPDRGQLVTWWVGEVTHAQQQYEEVFRRMRDQQRFARGHQWPRDQKDNYVVNVTLRQIGQRVAALYAKNPTAVARVRPRLENTVWDGTPESIARAQQTIQMAMQAGPALMEPGANPAAIQAVQAQVQQAQSVIADYERVTQERQMRERLGRTLELLFDYSVDEQVLPFKTMMKLAVRRALTTGVGWVKVGFQRASELTLDAEGRIRDMTEALAAVQSGAADLADGEVQAGQKEVEELRLQIAAIAQQGQILVREGLVFDYPNSTSIIPSTDCVHLKTFAGAPWVAQEYLLHPKQIQKIYGVDVSQQYTSHSGRAEHMGTTLRGAPPDAGHYPAGDQAQSHEKLARVFQSYCIDDGLVYTVCEGWPDFLTEPSPPGTPDQPGVWIERFYPWFAIIFNEVDDDSDGADAIWPPSDVDAVKHPQLEINRSRESLREHRIANRPAYAAASGMLSDQDKDRLRNRPASAILELQALQPGQSVDDLLQALRPAPLDPALYNVDPQFEDILRSGGLQEANLGGTSGATATESSIAQASLSQSSSSSVDDLDEVLTALARSGGQILLDNVSVETVKAVVGQGAVWPELSRAQIARDLWLEIEAGSTGRPNQAQEIANAERLVPLLLQIPGLNPEWLLREVVRRLDDRLDVQAAVTSGLPSITAMNSMAQPTLPGAGPSPASADTGAAGAPAGAAGGPGGAPGPGAPGQPGGVNTTQPAPSPVPAA